MKLNPSAGNSLSGGIINDANCVQADDDMTDEIDVEEEIFTLFP